MSERLDFYTDKEDILRALGGSEDLIKALVTAWREAAKRNPLTVICGDSPYKREIVNSVGEIRDIHSRNTGNPCQAQLVNSKIREICAYVENEQFPDQI